MGAASQDVHFCGGYIFFLASGYCATRFMVVSVPNFEKGSIRRKMSTWGDLNSSRHGYLPRGLTMFLVKEKKLKMKYGSEGPIPNVDLGLL